MKCTIPEISWHNREPVLSVDIQPISEKFYRLATGGADCHVLIWQLTINENGAVKTDALSDLTRHQKAINSVRWSPTGQYLATADDDANIIVWQLKTDNIPLLEGESNDKETWIVYKVMRGHKEDIYDLCWSPDGLKLLSGSIDNTAILWDFAKGKSDHILGDHKGFVQGVAWDPKGHYLATISTDRVCRIYESSGRQVKAKIQRGHLPTPKDHYLHNKDVKFFHDDTFKSFFRRLDFSPDGSLLAVPSGRVEVEDCKKIFNGTFMFAVDSWAGPVAVLPSGKQCSTVVRFCPVVFELHEDGPDPVISLPFRMIAAVGTDHDVILYDTQQLAPFAYFRDIHYTRLTDITWSKDGLLLVASSTDGYCALITFELNELGVQYVKEESEIEESVLDISGCEELQKDENPEIVKPKKLNVLEQWAIKTPKRDKKREATSHCSDDGGEVIIIDDDDTSKRKNEEEPKRIVPCKRIKPIPVEDKTVNHENISIQKEKNTPTSLIRRKEGCSLKVNPLTNFLRSKEKTVEANKTKKSCVLPPVALILDEIEARDAWKCEKNETKRPENNIIDIDEYTEDFSLHLEDTNSRAAKNVETEQSARKQAEDCVHDKIDTTETKQNTHESTIKHTTELNKLNTQTVTNSEEKVSVPKRRIPLITLSSPKHKKK